MLFRPIKCPHCEIISRSLPKADRDLVRTDAMQERVADEARSRAPRWQSPHRAG